MHLPLQVENPNSWVVVRFQVHGGDVAHFTVGPADGQTAGCYFNDRQKVSRKEGFLRDDPGVVLLYWQYLMSHQPLSDFFSTSTTEPMDTDTSSAFFVE